MSRFNFLIILLVGFVDYLGIALVYPIFAALLFDTSYELLPLDASLSYRGALLGILIALTPLSQFMTSPFLGAFSDRKGRRMALLLGIGIGCLGYALALTGLMTKSLSLLFLYRILVGVSEGTAAVAQAAIVDMSSEEERAKRFSWLSSSLGVGFMVGPFLGGKLSDAHFVSWGNYAIPFMLAGTFSLLNLILVWTAFPETHLQCKQVPFSWKDEVNSMRRVFALDHLRWLLLASFLLAFGWSFFNEFVPLFLQDRFQFSTGSIGDFYAYTSAWYAISAAFATAPLLKRFQAEKLLAFGLSACASFMLIILLVPDSSGLWFVLPFLMYFLALTFPTTTAAISSKVGTAHQGEVLGVYQAVQACAMGISPLLFGSAVGVYPFLAIVGGAVALLMGSWAAWKGSNRVQAAAYYR